MSTWYDELRQTYRPDRVRLLLVAESPPDPRGGALRFFYAPKLTADNLYRSVALALYGQEPAFNERDKPAVLERMRCDGVWLVDAVDVPVNALSSRERKTLISASVPELIEKCKAADPSVGVIICKGPVFTAVARPLGDAGINVLHEQPLPFPLGNWRSKFIEGMRAALSASDWRAS